MDQKDLPCDGHDTFIVRLWSSLVYSSEWLDNLDLAGKEEVAGKKSGLSKAHSCEQRARYQGNQVQMDDTQIHRRNGKREQKSTSERRPP